MLRASNHSTGFDELEKKPYRLSFAEPGLSSSLKTFPMDSIYLDHNATTPIHPLVVDEMVRCYREIQGNASSQHQAGQKARQTLEDARDGIAEILGATTTGVDADRVVFTSGGTEANNLALFGLIDDPTQRIIVSAIEHPSIAASAAELRRRGHTVDSLRVNENCVVDLDHLSESLNQKVPAHLISVMLGNHETGVVQPIAEVSSLGHQHGALVHTDAVQAVGKVSINFRELGVDAMSVAAHKFHGPIGIGVLLVKRKLSTRPQLFGGFQQLGVRPGTEPVALATGMHAALRLWRAERQSRFEQLRQLRDQFEAALLGENDKIVLNGIGPRLPHTSNLSFLGLDRQALVMALDLAGVQCSTGSACASGSSDPSPVLIAMGLPRSRIDSSLRFSFGTTTTAEDVREAVRRILSVVNNL